jgi:hypothetical protein
MRAAFLVCALCLISTAARAEVDATKFLSTYDALPPGEVKQQLAQYLDYIEDGMGWANSVLQSRNDQQLYCLPPSLTLTGDQLVNMVRRKVQQIPKLGEEPVGLVMLFALQEVFPCLPNSK